jgi:hypothetical protein
VRQQATPLAAARARERRSVRHHAVASVLKGEQVPTSSNALEVVVTVIHESETPTHCSSVGGSVGAIGSDIPIPRRSNRTNLANERSRAMERARRGSSSMVYARDRLVRVLADVAP